MAAWLSGNGCVPIYNLMEDAATAEISRAQLWQWVHQPNGVLADGRKVTARAGAARCSTSRWRNCGRRSAPERFAAGNYELARQLIEDIVLQGRVHRVHDARGIRALGLSAGAGTCTSGLEEEHDYARQRCPELEQSWKTDQRWAGSRRGPTRPTT